MEQAERVCKGRFQRTPLGNIGNLLPVDRGISPQEQLQVVQPDEPDEAVASCVRRKIYKFLFRRGYEHGQSLAQACRLRPSQQHLRRNLDAEAGVRAKMKLDWRFAWPRQSHVVTVFQDIVGSRAGCCDVPGVGQGFERCREIVGPDEQIDVACVPYGSRRVQAARQHGALERARIDSGGGQHRDRPCEPAIEVFVPEFLERNSVQHSLTQVLVQPWHLRQLCVRDPENAVTAGGIEKPVPHVAPAGEQLLECPGAPGAVVGRALQQRQQRRPHGLNVAGLGSHQAVGRLYGAVAP